MRDETKALIMKIIATELISDGNLCDVPVPETYDEITFDLCRLFMRIEKIADNYNLINDEIFSKENEEGFDFRKQLNYAINKTVG